MAEANLAGAGRAVGREPPLLHHLEELRILVEDTKAIVKAEMPGVDVTVAWNPSPDSR